jgi:hypothetical protein
MAQRGRIRPRTLCIVQSFPPACLFHRSNAMNTPAIIAGPWLLAQLSEGPYVPPPLPAPPRLPHYLFENPWPGAVFLLVIAVLVLFIGNSRGRAREGALLAGLLALSAAGFIAASLLVTTERERLRDEMRRLIAATATADTEALAPLLASDVALNVLGRQFPEDKEGILGLVAAHVDRHGGGQTLGRVRVSADVAGMTDVGNRSWWRVTWRKGPDGRWTAVNIEGLQIDMVQAGMLPR